MASGLEAALAECCDSVSRFAETGSCRFEGLTANEPDRPALGLALALAAAASGVPAPEVTIEPLPDRDWLAESHERFAAFRIGRFVVREPEDQTPVPPGAIALRIAAATAFGSGRHGSTEGCLRALDMLRGRRIRRALDLGCGSGILAIAAAKLWRVGVLASDIDPHAVAVARANARLNGVGHLVRVVVADGYRSSSIAARSPVRSRALQYPVAAAETDGGRSRPASGPRRHRHPRRAARARRQRCSGPRIVPSVSDCCADRCRRLADARPPPRAASGYFRCSLSRGISSTKLQGRLRLSSW